jgi:L-fuculose-phosphate aldolase
MSAVEPLRGRLRAGIVATARAMNAAGINRGRAGNVSARLADDGFDGFLVTPSGFRYDAMVEEDVVAMTLEGVASGRHQPSSEWRFHRDIYRARREVAAIVHTHAPFATTLACVERDIPPFHYMVARAGGRDIRCAPYATFGTQELSDHAVRALEGRRACLLAHHGMIAVGASLEDALELAVEVEDPRLCSRFVGRWVSGVRVGPSPERLGEDAGRHVHQHQARARDRLEAARLVERVGLEYRHKGGSARVSRHGSEVTSGARGSN